MTSTRKISLAAQVLREKLLNDRARQRYRGTTVNEPSMQAKYALALCTMAEVEKCLAWEAKVLRYRSQPDCALALDRLVKTLREAR